MTPEKIISREERFPLKVVQPEFLESHLPGTLARLRGNDNFKPHLGKLPDGRLLMYVAHSHAEPAVASHNIEERGYSLSSHAVQYVSSDGGRTWHQGRHIRELMSGHEPSVTVHGSNLLVFTHVHGSGGYSDPYAERDHRYIQLARSEDGGVSYSRILMDHSFANARPGEQLQGSRNCIRLPDGRLYFGLGVGRRHLGAYSRDEGLTWDSSPVKIMGCSYPEKARSFFSEAVFFYSNSRRFIHGATGIL